MTAPDDEMGASGAMRRGDNMDHGAVRNLEQIQEHDDAAKMPRALSFALVGLGGAAIAFAVLAMGGRKSAPTEKRADPLGDLVATHAKQNPAQSPATNAPSAAMVATQLSAKDVTFPGILSDGTKQPTTALAAVRTPQPAAPPPPSDRLSVVQFAGGTPPVPHDDNDTPARAPEFAIAPPTGGPALPAQNVLEATSIVTHPRDAMTKSASESAQITTSPAAAAPSGHEGAWQLQVSSFKTQSEAEQFADQLRARGHKAYMVEAHVAGRGSWWRVRVGPFASKRAATAYRTTFEQKEHVVPFVVPPVGKDSEKDATEH